MCFFALLYKTVADFPLVLAANRDEFYDRPGTGPREVHPGVVAGLDGRAGGTWLGGTHRGLIVAVTNRYTTAAMAAPVVGGPSRSRGLLCLDLLDLPDAKAAEQALMAQLRDHDYSEFNLVIADPQTALSVSYSGGRLQVQALEPGLHIVANTWMNNEADAKVARGRSLIGDIPRPTVTGEISPLLLHLQKVCGDHGDGNEDAICIHGPRHGTLSSTIIAVHKSDAARHRYFFADGPPCKIPYRDYSSLLQ